MVTEADWESWKGKDFVPYMDIVLEAFGAERVMVGSDWPVCTLAAEYEQVIEITAEFIEQLSPTEKSAIWGENAKRIYQLCL
jgi:L-fuconolactonase